MVKVVLACLGNTEHFPSQQAAQQLLMTLVSLDSGTVDVLVALMGSSDFARLVLSNPQSLLERLTGARRLHSPRQGAAAAAAL